MKNRSTYMKTIFDKIFLITVIGLLSFQNVSAGNSQGGDYRKVEALGAYLMAVAIAEDIKGSSCGFALPANPNMNKEFRDYLKYFSYKTRNDIKKEFAEINIPAEAAKGAEKLHQRIERKAPDSNTACGTLVGMVMSEVSRSKGVLDQLIK